MRKLTGDSDDIVTSADRRAAIDDYALHASNPKTTAAQWAAHITRLRLIYKPFPVVRRLGTGSACPWAGTIVVNHFDIGIGHGGVRSDSADNGFDVAKAVEEYGAYA